MRLLTIPINEQLNRALYALALADAGVSLASDAWQAIRDRSKPRVSPFTPKAEAEALARFERAVARRVNASAEVQRLEAIICTK
jgi:hypothetical protein